RKERGIRRGRTTSPDSACEVPEAWVEADDKNEGDSVSPSSDERATWVDRKSDSSVTTPAGHAPERSTSTPPLFSTTGSTEQPRPSSERPSQLTDFKSAPPWPRTRCAAAAGNRRCRSDRRRAGWRLGRS